MKEKYASEKQLSQYKGANRKYASAKRVNIVSLKLVKESSLLYKERSVSI